MCARTRRVARCAGAASVLLIVLCAAPAGQAQTETQVYCVKGNGSGVTWEWEIPGDCSGIGANACGPVGSGEPAAWLAIKWVQCVNMNCSPPTGMTESAEFIGSGEVAQQNCPDATWEALFKITRDLPLTDANFELFVKNPDCNTSTNVCNFNAQITEATPPSTPAVNGWTRYALVGLVLLAASVLILRRFVLGGAGPA